VLPLIQLSGIAAVGLISLAHPLRDKSAGFLAGVALLLLSAAGVPLYLTGLLGGLGGWLVVTLVEGPSQWQAAAEDARRPPDLEARWEQVHAAQRVWLDADGIVLSDGAGHRFRKRPGWQMLQNFVFIGRLQNEAHDVSIPVEGDIVAEGEAAVERTYSGESIFSFHRRDDRRWFLTAVTLKDLSLTSEVSIDLSQFAGVRPLPSRAPANPAVQLTKATAQAALVEWLASRYPLAGEFMKDPGGTVEVLRLRGKEARVRFDKVPYHRWRDGGRHEYSGPGLAQFSGDSAGQWALSGVRLSELTLDRDPAQWSDSPDHGIRVR
jgi:hypothetical protein